MLILSWKVEKHTHIYLLWSPVIAYSASQPVFTRPWSWTQGKWAKLQFLPLRIALPSSYYILNASHNCISVVSWRTVTIIVLIGKGKSKIKKNKTLPSVTGIIVNAGIGLHMRLAPEVMTFASAHLLRDSTSREQVCLYLSTLSQREPIIIGHGGWSEQFFQMCRQVVSTSDQSSKTSKPYGWNNRATLNKSSPCEVSV